MSDREDHPFRTESRARAALRVRLRGQGEQSGVEGWAVTRDVSRGGAFLRGADPLSPGTRLRLSIQGSGEHDDMEVEAEVKWSAREPDSERGLGVAFVNPPAAVRRRIERMETQGELPILELYEDPEA